MTNSDETDIKTAAQALATDLQQLPQVARNTPTIRQLVSELYADIETAIAKGNDWETIAQQFSKRGINTTAKTLQVYLRAERQQRGKNKTNRHAKSNEKTMKKNGKTAKITNAKPIVKDTVKSPAIPWQLDQEESDNTPAQFLEIDEDSL